MIFFTLFILLVSSAHNGTRNYADCQSLKFEPKACWEAHQLYKAGKFGCTAQGKGYSGKSDCK